MIALFLRDLRRGYAGGGATLIVIFFLLVAILFPFAIGPDPALLARIGGGVVWAAALLAALLPVERLVAPDVEHGVIDQLAMRGHPLSVVAAVKIAAHWCAFAPPLAIATLAAAALFGLPGKTLAAAGLGLVIGTPALAALAVATAALTAGLRGAGAVAGLILLPFAVPLLIFGAGAIDGGSAAFKLLAATTLVIVAGAPFVAAAAIRAGMD